MYSILHYDSEVYHAFKPGRPILVDKQSTTFFHSKPPTTETILQRLLRGFLQIPSALWRPYDLHEDPFSEWSHGCVVQMLYKSITKRGWTGTGDKPGVKRENARLPLLSVDRILTELDICFEECHDTAGEFPFEEGGWREDGVPSAMVVRFCERQTEQDNPTTCAIFHNEHKIFE